MAWHESLVTFAAGAAAASFGAWLNHFFELRRRRDDRAAKHSEDLDGQRRAAYVRLRGIQARLEWLAWESVRRAAYIIDRHLAVSLKEAAAAMENADTAYRDAYRELLELVAEVEILFDLDRPAHEAIKKILDFVPPNINPQELVMEKDAKNAANRILDLHKSHWPPDCLFRWIVSLRTSRIGFGPRSHPLLLSLLGLGNYEFLVLHSRAQFVSGLPT